MKLVHQYMIIFFNFSPTSNHLHPLQVENCDSNSRLVVDEDDNVKSGLKGLKGLAKPTTWINQNKTLSGALFNHSILTFIIEMLNNVDISQKTYLHQTAIEPARQ